MPAMMGAGMGSVVSPMPSEMIFASGFSARCAFLMRLISGKRYPAWSFAMLGLRVTLVPATMTEVRRPEDAGAVVRLFSRVAMVRGTRGKGQFVREDVGSSHAHASERCERVPIGGFAIG